MADELIHSFAGGTLNRAALERPLEGFVDAQLTSATAQIISFAGDRALIDVSDDQPKLHLVTRGDLPNSGPIPPIFLGLREDESPVFAQFTDVLDDGAPATSFPDHIKAIDLRSLAGQAILPPEELGLLAYARSLTAWHSAHRFCANCGHATVIKTGGDRRHCDACQREHYPRTDPVAIMLVHKGDKCLLGRGRHFEELRYSALAGFVETGETIEEAARREILEESGVLVGSISYHSSQPWPFVSSLMIGLMGEALSEDIVMDEAELEDVRWFSRADAKAMLDGTHKQGFSAPPPLAIAHHLLQSFVNA